MTAVLISAPEMAQKLNVSERHLRNLVRYGRVPCVRLGRRTLFDEPDVLHALKGASYSGEYGQRRAADGNADA